MRMAPTARFITFEILTTASLLRVGFKVTQICLCPGAKPEKISPWLINASKQRIDGLMQDRRQASEEHASWVADPRAKLGVDGQRASIV
jgi:hypothetical protein